MPMHFHMEEVMTRQYKPRSVTYGPPPSYRVTGRGACVRLNVTLSLQVAEALRVAAQLHGPNMSAIVEGAVRRELQRLEVIP
jgi:hypothetical protein